MDNTVTTALRLYDCHAGVKKESGYVRPARSPVDWRGGKNPTHSNSTHAEKRKVWAIYAQRSITLVYRGSGLDYSPSWNRRSSHFDEAELFGKRSVRRGGEDIRLILRHEGAVERFVHSSIEYTRETTLK